MLPRLVELDIRLCLSVCVCWGGRHIQSYLPVCIPRWRSGKEPTFQRRGCGFDPWVGKIPWRRKWQPTPVFLPGKFQKKHILLLYWLCQSLCVDHNKLWKILQEMGIPNHLTCLLRNLYAGQEATVRTGHGTTDWFQIRKWVHQGCILSPCLFNLYAEYIMWNVRLDEAQAGIKIAGRISITSDMQMTPP